MKYQVPFSFVGFIKRLTGSWTTTKTTDEAIKNQINDQQVEHTTVPPVKNNTIVSISYMGMNAGEDYCSTY